MKAHHLIFRFLCALFLLPCAPLLYAQCDSPVATLSAIEGMVELRRGDETAWRRGLADEDLCAGDTVRVGNNSRGALVLADHTLVRLGASTTVTITGPREEKGFFVQLLEGITHFMSRVPRTLEVETPFVNAGVEGTEFLVRVSGSETFVSVYEGKVAMENEAGSLLLLNGQSGSAGPGSAPVLQVVARPRDAVQWTLYYPPLLSGKAYAAGAADGSPLARAMALHSEGRAREALEILEQTTAPDAGTLTYRAALRLSVGQVNGAVEDVERSLGLKPGDGNALALRSIIAVVQGDSAQALRDAETAVKIDPEAAAPRLALSYALQSRFELEAALQVMEKAAAAAPDNALVWARLAEVHLMFRHTGEALEASERAIALSPPGDPGGAYAHMVQGFARLIAMDTGAASRAFDTAIKQDPSAPLPRLGQGLALVRRGELEQGRRAIEIAAILDPGNALVRSYLGKAYYEERRDALASDQYAMAMELDPRDPTPAFYDAILKQADNRPVEALDSMEQAIEKNDNRAVYRSRFLLDEDLATRGVSVAGIYNTLGFDELARAEADYSMGLDPGNYTAHRFLADSYSGLPRHEVARASELLKSQLLQPLNHSPLQPHIAESDLFVIERSGAGDAAYHEYHPMFTRDSATFQASVLTGDHGTLSDEMIVAGTGEHASFSLGQYHYESDGFRENNDLQHDIYNVFGQYAFSPKLSVQAEYRHRETESGDLTLHFDPDLFLPNLRSESEQETKRLGLHYQPSPGHHLLVSAVRVDIDSFVDDTEIRDLSEYAGLVPFDVVGTSAVYSHQVATTGYSEQVELQYLHAEKWYTATYGAGALDQELDRDVRFVKTFVVPDDRFIPVPLPPPFTPYPNVPVIASSSEWDVGAEHRNAYVYLNINAIKDMVWTLGASYDSFENVAGDSERVNPKAGLSWQVTPSTRMRAAWFKTTTHPYASNQTIEPTQIAGFNQFFDETGGSLAERYGAAVDHRVSRNLYAGLSGSRRESEQPQYGAVTVPNVMEEEAYEGYLFWTINHRLVLGARLVQEDLKQSFALPQDLNTLRAPVSLSYFAPNGLYGTMTATYVEQSIESSDVVGTGEEQFWNVDAALGYKLPKRYGIIRLVVRNLFDDEFRYWDSSSPVTPRYLPERFVFGELRINVI